MSKFWILLSAACALMLAACATTAPVSGNGTSPTGAGSSVKSLGPAKTFSGPWASTMQQLYAAAVTPEGRSALDDGTLTEAEVAALKSLFGTCMAGNGATVNWAPDADTFDVSGLSVNPSKAELDREGAQEAECERASDTKIVSLYYQMRRNPSSLDELTIVSACLQKAGVVGNGYTADDLKRDMAASPISQMLETEAAKRCFASPLGTS